MDAWSNQGERAGGTSEAGTAIPAPVGVDVEPTAPPGADAAAATVALTEDAEPTNPATRPRTLGRPASITAISLILLLAGGALEGYAIAQAAGPDPLTRQYSLIWAILGTSLVVTAWALRAGRWWGAAAAIAVAIVGLFAGMYGVYALLVIANRNVDCAADAAGSCITSAEAWLTGVGLVAVGAASIAIIGLLSSGWTWLTAPTRRRTARTDPPAAT